MSEEAYYDVSPGGKVTQIVVADQRWRVEVLFKNASHPVVEYDGSNYDELAGCIGGLCLSTNVQSITIYRNNEQHASIEVMRVLGQEGSDKGGRNMVRLTEPKPILFRQEGNGRQ